MTWSRPPPALRRRIPSTRSPPTSRSASFFLFSFGFAPARVRVRVQTPPLWTVVAALYAGHRCVSSVPVFGDFTSLAALLSSRLQLKDAVSECSPRTSPHCSGPMTSGLNMVYMSCHCHAPSCLSCELYNADTGKLICRQVPSIGTSPTASAANPYDEEGYIAVPPCLFGNASEGLAPEPFLAYDQNLTSIKKNNNTYGHYGTWRDETRRPPPVGQSRCALLPSHEHDRCIRPLNVVVLQARWRCGRTGGTRCISRRSRCRDRTSTPLNNNHSPAGGAKMRMAGFCVRVPLAR